LGGDISWPDRLAYRLRVATGWFVALRLLLVLLRQGRWNTQVLRRCHVELRLAGTPVAGRPPSLVRTPVQHYWRLLRAMPSLAHDEADVWAQRLRDLYQKIREATEHSPGSRKTLSDPDARQLQYLFLQKFFQARLRIDLPPPADAFARYRSSSEALRDFFDFCAAQGRLTDREEVERAMGDFAKLVQRYRVDHGGQNPPRGYFHERADMHRRFLKRLTRFLGPARLLAQIYWGKVHAQRVIQGLRLPGWVEDALTGQLTLPPGVPRELVRSALVFETGLQGLRLLAEMCTGFGANHQSPKLSGLIHEAIHGLQKGIDTFAAG